MSLKIEYKKDDLTIKDSDNVRVITSGNVIEIMKFDHKNNGSPIRVIDGDHYFTYEDFERLLNDKDWDGDITDIIKSRFHGLSRLDNISYVRNSLKNLRDIINTNCVDTSRCHWVTLTYAENMTDTKRLYEDFKNFVKRFRYQFGDDIEYICASEPQGRGAWHCHVIFIFPNKAPFIPKSTYEDLWGFGFVKVKSLKNIDNVGAYLSAYLGDFDTESSPNLYIPEGCNITEKQAFDSESEKKKKRILKGARLSLYPKGFHIWRISEGIKKPQIEYMTYKSIKEKVSSAKLTYHKGCTLIDSDTDYCNDLIYEYYNLAR